MAAAYELAKGPTPITGGIFLRNRSQAVSVRARRRRVVDQNDNEVEEERDAPKTPTLGQSRRKSRYSNDFDESSAKMHAKSEERLFSSDILQQRRERAYSNDWDGEKRRKNSFDHIDELPMQRPVSRRGFDRKSEIFTRSHSRAGGRSSGPMETLDRRISASTDNLDTLKREKRATRVWQENQLNSSELISTRRPSSSAAKHRNSNGSAVDAADFTFRINGEKMSKNKYFFGSDLKSAIISKKSSGATQRKEEKKQSKSRKSAVEIFLEDQGPYSRKLYGPPPPKSTNENFEKTKRARSQEVLLCENTPLTSPEEGEGHLKKGLLWQQRDKLFSRWKERYFVLTKDYVHCFKKATSRISEMGGFIFKLKLTEVDSIELLDKRGYLTVCISLVKDGKIYLRRPEGIREWFAALQVNIYECKKRRKFWVKRQVTDSDNIEQWLLARQKISGMQYCSSGSSPNILDSSEVNNHANEEVTSSDKKSHGNRPPNGASNGATVVSRSAMVEAAVEAEEKSKPVKNVCLVDIPQIFPLPTSMTTTRAIIESSSSNSSGESTTIHQQQPRAINRLNLVNELILKEKSEHVPSIEEDGALSSASSTLADSSTTDKSCQNEIGETNKKNRVDDSSNDSGHNSMNTNSSDSQSDGTNSCGEDKPSNGVIKPGSNTIKITNNGHSMKILVEGAGSYGLQKLGKTVDADKILSNDNIKNSNRPTLMPRPSSALTAASIMRYRGRHEAC